MKQTLLASAALAAFFAGPASAQDDAGFDARWSGFYAGVQVGTINSGFELEGSDAFDGEYSEEGFIGGVYAGYDRQFGPFVLGALADIDAVSIDGTDLVGKSEGYSYDVDWVATARARAGVAEGRALFYGTGGFAFASIDASAAGVGGESESADIEVGGALGAGLEFAFTPHVSMKVEYLHYFFDDIEPADGGVSFNPDMDALKIGLAYRF